MPSHRPLSRISDRSSSTINESLTDDSANIPSSPPELRSTPSRPLLKRPPTVHRPTTATITRPPTGGRPPTLGDIWARDVWDHNSRVFVLDGANSLKDPNEGNGVDENLFWSRLRYKLREPFSEFMGTFTLVLIGNGVVAQVILSGYKNGDYQSICWGYGIGVMLGIYVAGKSGGHINPAVTIANCVFRQFPWRKAPAYILAQFLGAFCAAGVVYANYNSAIDVFEGEVGLRTVTGPTSTGGIFCTYPLGFMTRTGMFFSEFIASTILMFCLYALLDDNNVGAGVLLPLGMFFVVFAIGAGFGFETGFAINPARDFGPRVMTALLGYGRDVWTGPVGKHYFWVPLIAPFFGCLFGAFLYDVFIYSGESPINTPWLGIRRLLPMGKKQKAQYQARTEPKLPV